jgi:hypothetical protein
MKMHVLLIQSICANVTLMNSGDPGPQDLVYADFK